MAATSFTGLVTTGSPADQIIYGGGDVSVGAKLWDPFAPFTGDETSAGDGNYIFVKLKDYATNKGSTLKSRFQMLDHNPTLRREPVEGQGDNVQFVETEIGVDLVTMQHYLGFQPDQTFRTKVDIEASHKRQLMTKIGDYTARTLWYHLSGAVADSYDYALDATTNLLTAKADYLQRVGNNAISTYDSTSHYVVGDNFTTTETGVGSTDTLSIATIRALEKAATNFYSRRFPITPVQTPYHSEPKFVLFVDEEGYSQLANEYSTTSNPGFMNLNMARQQGGASIEESVLYKLQNFTIADTVVVKVPYRTYGMNGSTVLANVRRAVFCGRRSMHVGYAASHSATKWKYVEEETMLRKTIAAFSIWGCKRVVPTVTAQFPNTQSFGSILVSHYGT
jgi:Protein of unknown function (DUF4043)